MASPRRFYEGFEQRTSVRREASETFPEGMWRRRGRGIRKHCKVGPEEHARIQPVLRQGKRIVLH